MGCVGRAIGIHCIVGIAVVGDDDSLVASLLGSLDNVFHTLVNSFHGSLDGAVYAGVAHHVAIGKVHDDEVVLVFADSFHELGAHLVGTHLGLQVIGSHLG